MSVYTKIIRMSDNELSGSCRLLREDWTRIKDGLLEKAKTPGRTFTARAYERRYDANYPYNTNVQELKNLQDPWEAYKAARRLALYLDFILPDDEESCVEWELVVNKTDQEKTCINIRNNVRFMKDWPDEAIRNFFKHFGR